MSTDHLRLMLRAATRKAGVSPFSAEFVWDSRHSALRFQAFISPGGSMTMLDAVLRAELTEEERHRIFPTPLDLGRKNKLEPYQRTYQAIANTVANQLKLDRSGFDENYIKQTAASIGELAGFPFDVYRERDPDLAARVLKLFVYLKKTRGPGVVGMLKPPGNDRSPSLELTNPYPWGTGDQKRQLYADIKSYLSAQIPPERLAAIDACFASLRPELGRFLGELLHQIHDTPVLPDGHLPTVRDACDRLQRAAEVYKKGLLAPNTTPSKVLLPLDEQLYVHLQTLEFLHYTEFMRRLRGRELIRANVQPSVQVFGASRVRARYLDLQQHIDDYMPLRPVVEHAFGETIEPLDFKRAILMGSHVLRHYLQVRTLDPDATADFRLVTATLCFAMDLISSRVPQYKPYIHGQGNISGSVLGAMLDEVNKRHEEFERICSESVDWYQAVLTGQTKPHQAHHDLVALFERSTAELCRSHDTERIAAFLGALGIPEVKSAWLEC